jgi:hypothetical protein
VSQRRATQLGVLKAPMNYLADEEVSGANMELDLTAGGMPTNHTKAVRASHC